ncbi:MAG: glyceraldehyde-3-phosphate dehydrogenase [Albidovulum sp.]
MTNRIAMALAIIIALALALDLWVQEGAASMFLIRKLTELVDYAAFWR